jgi:hypothetical protein
MPGGRWPFIAGSIDDSCFPTSGSLADPARASCVSGFHRRLHYDCGNHRGIHRDRHCGIEAGGG